MYLYLLNVVAYSLTHSLALLPTFLVTYLSHDLTPLIYSFTAMSCSEGRLACANEQQCIDRELWCNGVADCNDESDEQGWWVL